MKSKRELLIPATATVALAFGGAGCDGESQKGVYERACEKVQECSPDAFSPGGDDERYYTSIEDCAEETLAYTRSIVSDYAEEATDQEACYQAAFELYDCFNEAFVETEGCDYSEPVYEACEGEYEDFALACDLGDSYE